MSTPVAPQAIDDAFRDLCHMHNLTSLNVSFTMMEGVNQYWSAYAHWDGHSNTGHNCCSGHGTTASEAIRDTINRANGERVIGVSVPDMVLE